MLISLSRVTLPSTNNLSLAVKSSDTNNLSPIVTSFANVFSGKTPPAIAFVGILPGAKLLNAKSPVTVKFFVVKVSSKVALLLTVSVLFITISSLKVTSLVNSASFVTNNLLANVTSLFNVSPGNTPLMIADDGILSLA